MSILRVQLLALLVLPVLANAALSATLRISRLDGFNASNRQPTVWLNHGAAIDIPMNRPIEFQVEPGKHTITIATRVPADPSQFMQRQHEQILLEADDVFEIELKWVAGIFVGKHEVKISRIDTPRVTPTATQLSSTQPVIEVKPILSGQGVRTWPDGTQSEGYLVNGLVQGFGITKFANGNRYEGEHLNGRLTGRGEFFWPDGNRYVGDMLNGALTGKGVFTWSNGNQYTGDLVNGVKTGKGVFTTPKGGRFDGYYLNNRFHGEGRLVTEDGRHLSGFFQDDKLVEEKRTAASAAPTNSTTSAEGLSVLLQLLGAFVEGRNASRTPPQRDNDPVFRGETTVNCDARRTNVTTNPGMTQNYQINCR